MDISAFDQRAASQRDEHESSLPLPSAPPLSHGSANATFSPNLL